MSEVAENSENNTEQGIEQMSITDALNYAKGETTEFVKTEPEQEKEVVAEEKTEEQPTEAQAEPIEKEVVETKVVEEPVKTETLPKVEEKKVEPEAKDPFEGIDEEDIPYYKFKKNNPGTTRADYEDSLVDYDKFDRKELLRRSLREKYNINDSDKDLNEYIETEHGIPMDSDESEMSLTERVRLRKLTDDFVKSKKEQHAKWAEVKTDEKVAQQEPQEEMVTLEDGRQMPKKEYDQQIELRNNYVKNNEDALNRVKETSFKLKVSENGSERELDYSYTFDTEDKHRMLSISSDVVANFNKTYTTENGFNHEGINIDQAWADQQLRGKMLKSLAQSIRAEAIEEVMKEQGNVNLNSQKSLPQQETNGVKYVSLSDIRSN